MASESSAKSGAKNRRTPATRLLIRFGGIAIAVGVVLSGCIYASESFERFLIRDPRFFTLTRTVLDAESRKTRCGVMCG